MTATQFLTESRAADRKVMSVELQALIRECGAEVLQVDETSREILIRLRAPGGLSVSVELDGRNPCGKDSYFLSWYIDFHSNNQIDAAVFPGSVNPHHKAKASSGAAGYPALKELLRKCLTMAADGTAYLRVAEPALA